MCGITGYIDFKRRSTNEELTHVVKEMRDMIAYRGPDHAQSWVDETAGIALGHRRLAILDLSPEGHQPMHSADGRYIIVFNGEIFNFLELRAELEQKGHRFRGNSDTETMLSAFCEWGIAKSVERFNGEFAFVVWDQQERTLTLVRDRIGVKPLYYAWINEYFMFASELKAFLAHPGFEGEIDRDALALMLRYNYVPAPYSIYKDVFKLPAGTSLIVTLASGSRPEPHPYWSATVVAAEGLAHPFHGTPEEAVDVLDRLLSDAVRIRMIADVPLGAFLSGGIDSSTVVALMQRQSSVPVKTFSIGFHEAKYDEALHAKAVAQHLGTDHTELYISSQDALSLIPKLPEIYDEPFSDYSQIPTHLISVLTRRYVTVSLSGDGGDELFSGYDQYFNTLFLDDRLSHDPAWLRFAVATLLDNLQYPAWKLLRPLIPGRYKGLITGRRVYSLAHLMRQNSCEALYREMLSTWKTNVVLGARDLSTPVTDPRRWITNGNRLDWMQSIDLIQHLPDDILVKLDRASMQTSLEARVPILDYRIIEWVWTLPQVMKVRDGVRKWILRQVLYRYVPRVLVDRPKKGFGIPIDVWLRTDLRDWAEALLDEQCLRAEGYLDAKSIRDYWQAHLAGNIDWGYYLWGVLMFQAWLHAPSRITVH